MARFNENMYLDSLPATIYKELVNELSKNSCWMQLAYHVAEQLEYNSNLWIQSLKNSVNVSSINTPAEKLLFELNTKMCTVGILCALLEDCELLNVLSILRLPEELVIVQHPTDDMQNNTLELSCGQGLHLSCKAVGIPPPSYIWYHGNSQLENCNSPDLDLVINSPSQAGEYRCKISQIRNDGAVISASLSNSVFVRVSPIIIIEQHPPPHLKVKQGKGFTISCKVSFSSRLHYQWFKDDKKLKGETSNKLQIENFSLQDEGEYYCCISNDVSKKCTQKSYVTLDVPRQKAVGKVALIIGNQEYENYERLITPVNDAAKLGNLLEKIGFKVICLMNLTFAQIKSAIKIFSRLLSKGVYGVFYFAGHGFKMQESYMLAVDAPHSALRKDAICESELLALLLQCNPALLVVILDMCQRVPTKESNPTIHEEVPFINKYKNCRNLVQAYSTSSDRPSYEKTNRRYGFYVTHLKKYIDKDILVTDVFEEVGKSVARAVDAEIRDRECIQIPMFASTITEPFRLTDAICKENLPAAIKDLERLVTFPPRILDIKFKKTGLSGKIKLELSQIPHLNSMNIEVAELENYDDWEINFFLCPDAKPNTLFQYGRGKCKLIDLQIFKGPLIIAISKEQTPVDIIPFDMRRFIPELLRKFE